MIACFTHGVGHIDLARIDPALFGEDFTCIKTFELGCGRGHERLIPTPLFPDIAVPLADRILASLVAGNSFLADEFEIICTKERNHMQLQMLVHAADAGEMLPVEEIQAFRGVRFGLQRIPQHGHGFCLVI